jgi:1-acyl-sn-glycerol-3-phosphate acyltransferase
MIGALRYGLTLLVATVYYGLIVMGAGVFRVRYRPGGVYDAMPYRWASFLIRANRLSVHVEGLDRLEPGRPYVFASNHLSFVDIWALLVTLPGSIRFVAKRGLAWVPIMGNAMRIARHVFIDRRNLASAMAAYDEAARVMRSGISAVVFVEGTRSRDGRLREFKKGGFVLAIAAQAPLVPVCVTGSWAILPRSNLTMRPGPITVRVGQPIPTAHLSYDDRDALSARCRAAILSMGAIEH